MKRSGSVPTPVLHLRRAKVHRRHFSANDICKETNQLQDVEDDEEEYTDIPPSKPPDNEGPSYPEATVKKGPQQPRRKKGRLDLRKPKSTAYERFDEADFGKRRLSHQHERRKSLLALELKVDEETPDTGQPSPSASAYNKLLNQKMLSPPKGDVRRDSGIDPKIEQSPSGSVTYDFGQEDIIF